MEIRTLGQLFHKTENKAAAGVRLKFLNLCSPQYVSTVSKAFSRGIEPGRVVQHRPSRISFFPHSRGTTSTLAPALFLITRPTHLRLRLSPPFAIPRFSRWRLNCGRFSMDTRTHTDTSQATQPGKTRPGKTCLYSQSRATCEEKSCNFISFVRPGETRAQRFYSAFASPTVTSPTLCQLSLSHLSISRSPALLGRRIVFLALFAVVSLAFLLIPYCVSRSLFRFVRCA